MRLKPALLLVPIALSLLACAPEEKAETVTEVDSCATDQLALLTAGTLTIATDSPAYEPWFVDDDPTNGKGFESAVAYAVAEQLGLEAADVTWVKVPFNKSYAPGEKAFDFDINQISITPPRQKVVDFSDGYYSAAQAVITLKTTADKAGSLADLAGLRLGAQTGTTSLTAIREDIQPSQDPLVFNDTNAAKQALLNGQVDAIVTDLPTAFYITAVEIPKSTITGQFSPSGDPEEFGLLMGKGSELLPCVNEAVSALKDDGTLAELEQKWLSDVVDVPVLQ
ncbi:Amino acid ABC transporter substrate-binding protein, PAAT family [metagenome]|uniref:Amino acid ABC transporter substrate-binding protein, PAAT family n=1 Tax=metagenome TaxID=256318 RepID=A0A2P2BYY5_9ZZZZ